MLPSLEELKKSLEELLPGVSLSVEGDSVLVDPKDIAAVSRCLRENERYGLDYLANLTAVDYPPAPAITTGGSGPAPAITTGGSGPAPALARDGQGPDPAAGGSGRIEVIYHLYSMAHKHGPIALKVKLPRQHPAVASVTPIWRGAEFQEREVYDLFGVTFTGHPDLRRILMWDGFEGYPMRKDYVPEDQDALEERVA